MFKVRAGRSRSARLAPSVLAAAVLSSSILVASVTGTLSAFTASITNSNNSAVTGSLVMQETDASGTTSNACLSSASSDNAFTTCTTFNKYGGTGTALTPGSTNPTTTVRIFNTGTVDATGFTLTPGNCGSVGSTTGNACDHVKVTLTCASVSSSGTVGPLTTLYNGATLTSIKNVDKTIASPCIPFKQSGNSVQFNFQVSLDVNAPNTVQGQTVTQPLVWKFTGA